jgi:hypothetical protein
MMNLLLDRYRDRRKLYLSWDPASWHISKRLSERIEENNKSATESGGPIVDTAPLPARAQSSMNAIAISANTRAAPAKKSGARNGCLLSSPSGTTAKTRDTSERPALERPLKAAHFACPVAHAIAAVLRASLTGFDRSPKPAQRSPGKAQARSTCSLRPDEPPTPGPLDQARRFGQRQ